MSVCSHENYLSLTLRVYIASLSESSPLVVDTTRPSLSTQQATTNPLSPLVSTSLSQPSPPQHQPQKPTLTTQIQSPVISTHQDAFMVGLSLGGIHVGSGALDSNESPLGSGPVQSPGFHQFPSGGSNLPVWMAAGGDILGSSTPGSVVGGFGSGLLSNSNSTGTCVYADCKRDCTTVHVSIHWCIFVCLI